jgi:hypothetical protein
MDVWCDGSEPDIVNLTVEAMKPFPQRARRPRDSRVVDCSRLRERHALAWSVSSTSLAQLRRLPLLLITYVLLDHHHWSRY